MKITVEHRCADFDSYRAARVKSLFNVESGANFSLSAELDIGADSPPWQIGVIVGPSGSGKTSLGRQLWGRTGGQAVLLSCHYDILDWVQPDWVFDTATGQFTRGWLRRRPAIELDIWRCGWEHWGAFEPHHYLKMPKMIAATNYVATVGGQLVAHLAVSTRSRHEARACRLVVMPEWQGAGVGLRFLDAVCQQWLDGQNRYGRPMPTLFHTSHPGLAAALRRSPKWAQVSAAPVGANKAKSAASIAKSQAKWGGGNRGAGYGGHFRAVQGFRYLGESPCA